MLFRRNSFWSQVSPGGALGDFVTVFRGAGRNRWRYAALAAAASAVILTPLLTDETRIPPRLPTITYITAFRPDRTDAEIRASNVVNQRRKERMAAEQAKRDEEVRQMYKTLGRATGIDVDQIERDAKAEQAASAAAGAKARP